MIAKIVHSSLNARGGSERLAIKTIKALGSAGYSIALETCEPPDLAAIRDAYDIDLSDVLLSSRTLRLAASGAPREGADLFFNAHGDILPFYRPGMSESNSITYCHFPIAGHLISSRDSEYEMWIRGLTMVSNRFKKRDGLLDLLGEQYAKMLLETKVITNSEFSRAAILASYGVESEVVWPPVEVDAFRKAAFSSESRRDLVLVVSRLHPSKRIENAIRTACLLRDQKIGRGMIIAGNISATGLHYLDYLRDMIRRHQLDEFVRIETNVKLSRLLELLRICKVYLHPLPGEPFGMSTVEAMSAGLIPVVHRIGGHAEFVPKSYWFDNFGEAARAISMALEAPYSERVAISESTDKFSTWNYIARIKRLASEVISGTKTDVADTELIVQTAKSRQGVPSYSSAIA